MTKENMSYQAYVYFSPALDYNNILNNPCQNTDVVINGQQCIN